MIRFLQNGACLAVAPGTRLMEVIDRHRVPIRFGCRRGQCTTCRVRVIEGALLPPGPIEQATLAQHDLPPGVRLSCQACVGAQSVTIAPCQE